MNQEKIGKFIAKCRKEKNLTQEALAEKLGISDRAVSKWERGLNLPDASLMINLANIFNISVNELLSGEIIEKKNYMNKAEEQLLEMAEKEENQNKKLMLCEMVIGVLSVIIFLILLFLAVYFIENQIAKVVTIIIAFIIFIISISFALKLETETGYYECAKCHHKYVPKYRSVFFAMHYWTTRYMKCPKCNRYSWQRKVLKK